MIWSTLRFTALATASALIALPALADTISFVFNNRSDYLVWELYAYPASTGSWGNDRLGSGTLDHGDSSTFSLSDERGCNYNLVVVFESGAMTTDTINICQTRSYTLTD